MGADDKEYSSYPEVKERLDAIANQVSDESLPLDDALRLYEEAVKLAMRASELIDVVDEPTEPQETELSDDAHGDIPNQE